MNIFWTPPNTQVKSNSHNKKYWPNFYTILITFNILHFTSRYILRYTKEKFSFFIIIITQNSGTFLLQCTTEHHYYGSNNNV